MGTSYEQGRPASPGGAGPAGGRPPPWGGRGGGGGPAALYLDVPPTAATGPHQSDTQVPHGRGWTKRVFSPAAIPPAATTAHHHRGFYPPAGGNDPEAARPPPDPADVSSALAAAQFAETSMRNGFVAKVFGLVGTMLAATVGFAALTMFHPGVKAYVRGSGAWLYFVAWGASLAVLIALSCSATLRRRWPQNMFALAAFTACEALLVGTITAYHDTTVVMLAFLATGAAVAGLALFALQSKVDVTGWRGGLTVALLVLLAVMFVGIFWPSPHKPKILHLVIAGGGALLFSLYLVYDIQMIMGGRQHAASPDEYIFAALSLYLDVVLLFLFLLQLVGLGRAGGQ